MKTATQHCIQTWTTLSCDIHAHFVELLLENEVPPLLFYRKWCIIILTALLSECELLLEVSNMSNRITGKEYALSDIFSKQFDYSIPPYQRQTVVKRQQALIKVFTDEWNLKYIPQGTVDLTDDGAIIYHITLRGSNATGYANNDHFIVFKGSRIVADTVPSFAQYYPNAFDLRD